MSASPISYNDVQLLHEKGSGNKEEHGNDDGNDDNDDNDNETTKAFCHQPSSSFTANHESAVLVPYFIIHIVPVASYTSFQHYIVLLFKRVHITLGSEY